ncbi:hypothetical protein [Leptospira licerasiae]|uniref:hypothetical protein n=1 Tax=Leptospira licerasiae TaxID=447106 RepID=UPI001082DA05|nr:hypothetical protein [Leptospira licerasiae]TGM87950.1 hypothetical protein EHR05_14975 [Leptospira licerasiae]
MKIIYLDHNIYSEFVSSSNKLYSDIYLILNKLVQQRKVIIPYSVSHIQETINRPHANSINKELEIINNLSQGAMLYPVGKNCTIVFNDAFTIFNNLKTNHFDLPIEFQEAYRIYESIKAIFQKIGFSPLFMNNKSYEAVTAELTQLFKDPKKYEKKISITEKKELEETANKMLMLLCSGVVRLAQESISNFNEIRKGLKELTRDHLKRTADKEGLFDLMKPEYREKIKGYRDNIRVCKNQIEDAIKLSSGILPQPQKAPITSHADLAQFFIESFAQNKTFQFRDETVLVSILEMAGYFPDSDKRKREVKKKGYFLEMFDMPHFNNSLFCDYFVSNDGSLYKRVNSVLSHLGYNKPKLLYPNEVIAELELIS